MQKFLHEILNHKDAAPPQVQEQVIQQEQQQTLGVNQYYSIQFKILNEETGEDIKKTKAYISYVSEQELKKLRDQFWETRVQGSKEIWQILRNAIEKDISIIFLSIREDVLAQLEANSIILINNSLQSVYDENGNRYDIPIFCINDPLKYEVREIIKSEGGLITVLVRSPKFQGQDLQIEIDLQSQVDILKDQIKKQKQVKTVRLFFGGMELKDQNFLSEFNLQENDIITAFL